MKLSLTDDHLMRSQSGTQAFYQKSDVVAALRSEILRMQGHKQANNHALQLKLGPIAEAFPDSTFPLNALHEFIIDDQELAAATSGFVCGIAASILGDNGVAIWIGSERSIFPPALNDFGIDADRIIFVEVQKPKDIQWVMEETLKCNPLSAVIGEVNEFNFISSRRLQLVVEKSNVTAFVLHKTRNVQNSTACASRWRINSMPSYPIDDLPGVGYPSWKVELLKVRNGKPGNWNVHWTPQGFAYHSNSYSKLPDLNIIHQAG